MIWERREEKKAKRNPNHQRGGRGIRERTENGRGKNLISRDLAHEDGLPKSSSARLYWGEQGLWSRASRGRGQVSIWKMGHENLASRKSLQWAVTREEKGVQQELGRQGHQLVRKDLGSKRGRKTRV